MAETKLLVDVVCVHYKSGHVKPIQIVWGNGVHYNVDKVLKIEQRASFKSGGSGLRYTCLIHGQQRYLYLQDDNSWFIEK